MPVLIKNYVKLDQGSWYEKGIFNIFNDYDDFKFYNA